MAAPPVTRLYREPVTQRFPSKREEGRVTERFETSGGGVPVGTLRPRELVAGRYRMLAGPLGGITGEAEVYRCRDEHLERELAVKLYRYDAHPKEEVIRQLEGLAHPRVLRLLAHGRWAGRFFEVTELCKGGVMADAMPFDEEALHALLPDIVQGLDFCHRQGIVHRDLKPNNLFFRDATRHQVLIGDFGISSYLERDAGTVRETRTAANLTLDYAAPELLDGHEVGPKTDYYALGITLLHLLLGRSPFHGLPPNDILVAHLRGRLEIPPQVSKPFGDLLRGLTLGRPELRWGFDQVIAWLRGDTPARPSDRTAWFTAPHRSNPYPGYPQAATPRQLAGALDRFDALRQLRRGDIRRWVFDHFDQGLAERIESLEQAGEERPELVLARLRLVLDPKAPLEVGERRLTRLAELAELLQEAPEGPLRERLGSLLRSGLLEDWIRSGELAGERTDELLGCIAGLRERLPSERHQEVALDGLLYTLVPTTPLRLGEGRFAAAPREVALAFGRDPARVGPVLTQHLFGKRLDEWLRATEFPGWREHLAFLQELRLFYLEQPLLGVHCLCWRFDPERPLLFDGAPVTRPERLARLIDQTPVNTARGLQLLRQGWLRAWLVGSGRIADSAALDMALLSLDMSPESKLEAVLHLLDPSLSSPRLQVDPDALHFGRLHIGDVRVRVLHVGNLGRGHLSGEIRLQRYGAGLVLDRYKVETNETHIRVRVMSLGLTPGHYSNALHVQTNGGDREIPVLFSVREPPDTRTWWQKLIERLS
jgi:hypothetical protein